MTQKSRVPSFFKRGLLFRSIQQDQNSKNLGGLLIPEILQVIFGYLGEKSQFQASLVCRHWFYSSCHLVPKKFCWDQETSPELMTRNLLTEPSYFTNWIELKFLPTLNALQPSSSTIKTKSGKQKMILWALKRSPTMKKYSENPLALALKDERFEKKINQIRVLVMKGYLDIGNHLLVPLTQSRLGTGLTRIILQTKSFFHYKDLTILLNSVPRLKSFELEAFGKPMDRPPKIGTVVMLMEMKIFRLRKLKMDLEGLHSTLARFPNLNELSIAENHELNWITMEGIPDLNYFVPKLDTLKLQEIGKQFMLNMINLQLFSKSLLANLKTLGLPTPWTDHLSTLMTPSLFINLQTLILTGIHFRVEVSDAFQCYLCQHAHQLEHLYAIGVRIHWLLTKNQDGKESHDGIDSGGTNDTSGGNHIGGGGGGWTHLKGSEEPMRWVCTKLQTLTMSYYTSIFCDLVAPSRLSKVSAESDRTITTVGNGITTTTVSGAVTQEILLAMDQEKERQRLVWMEQEQQQQQQQQQQHQLQHQTEEAGAVTRSTVGLLKSSAQTATAKRASALSTTAALGGNVMVSAVFRPEILPVMENLDRLQRVCLQHVLVKQGNQTSQMPEKYYPFVKLDNVECLMFEFEQWQVDGDKFPTPEMKWIFGQDNSGWMTRLRRVKVLRTGLSHWKQTAISTFIKRYFPKVKVSFPSVDYDTILEGDEGIWD